MNHVRSRSLAARSEERPAVYTYDHVLRLVTDFFASLNHGSQDEDDHCMVADTRERSFGEGLAAHHPGLDKWRETGRIRLVAVCLSVCLAEEDLQYIRLSDVPLTNLKYLLYLMLAQDGAAAL